MNPAIKKHWFKAVVSVLIIAIVGALGYEFISARSTYPVLGRAPNFTLSNTAGKPVSLQDTDGKVRLVTFFYTHCPDECPLTAYKMAQVQSELQKNNTFGKNVEFISISFDPTRDTPQVINDYAAKFHANLQGWLFLRGTNEQTDEVLKGFGVPVDKSKDTDFITHAAKTYLLDPSGNIRKTYGLGENMNVAEITQDIQNVIK